MAEVCAHISDTGQIVLHVGAPPPEGTGDLALSREQSFAIGTMALAVQQLGVSPESDVRMALFNSGDRKILMLYAGDEKTSFPRAASRVAESPSDVVLDIVLRWAWAETIGALGARVMADEPGNPESAWKLWFVTKNHRGEYVSLSARVHFEGKPEEGPPARFVLGKLGPRVWKLAPSVLEQGRLHAYLTIVDVPDPAPWERTDG